MKISDKTILSAHDPRIPLRQMKQLFRVKLLHWFRKNKRDFPWRDQGDWYKTYLSEMLLQQTQSAQALPYFHKFISRYPHIASLAAASEDDVLALWAGLGYYARARNMLKAAKILNEKYNGRFPREWNQALALPGIGPYSAAAILSIAFNKPFAVVDGNVLRVLSRVYAVGDDIRKASVHHAFQRLADDLLDTEQPGAFNEALMELGATVCLPATPHCGKCPLNELCRAFKEKRQQDFPYKSPPAPKKRLKQFVLLIKNGNRLFVRQRPGRGLLARMWEFPVMETGKLSLTKKELQKLIFQTIEVKTEKPVLLKKMTHIYSHIKLEYVPVLITAVKGKTDWSETPQKKWLSLPALEESALHGAHKKILTLPAFKQFMKEKPQKSYIHFRCSPTVTHTKKKQVKIND